MINTEEVIVAGVSQKLVMTWDPESNELMKELETLKDLVSQVMEAFSKMASQLPDEFLNNPDLSNMDFKDLFKDLEDIQKSI